MGRTARHSLACGAALLLLLVSACARAPWTELANRHDPDHLWPEPPATPRLTWAGELRDHGDLFSEGQGLGRLSVLLFGGSDSTLVRPFAIACHPGGGLLVSDPGRGCVHFFDTGRHHYAALGGERPGGLPSPVGVAALPDGRILVADSRLGHVFAYDREGAPLGRFGQTDRLDRPAGIAVRPAAGEVIIADATAHRLGVFDLEGRHLRWIGQRGTEPGRFNFPTHLAVDARGRLAVTDAMNFRVQVFDAGDVLEQVIGMAGGAPGRFARPKGVDFDAEGRIFVVEGLLDALQIFDAGGRLLLSIDGSGDSPGSFWLPAGLGIDRKQGLVYVADSYNSRVQVFRLLRADEVSAP